MKTLFVAFFIACVVPYSVAQTQNRGMNEEQVQELNRPTIVPVSITLFGIIIEVGGWDLW